MRGNRARLEQVTGSCQHGRHHFLYDPETSNHHQTKLARQRIITWRDWKLLLKNKATPVSSVQTKTHCLDAKANWQAKHVRASIHKLT